MLTDPRVSACIVLYHSGAQVLETIKCVMASVEPIDLYIVDNSPEETIGRVIQEMYPQVTYLPQTRNLGFGRANNLVLPMLRSRYHIILNPDITFEPDLVQRMAQFLDAHKDIDLLTPRVFNLDGTEQFLPRLQPTIRYLLSGRLEKRGSKFRQWRREFTMEDQHITQPVEVKFATGCFMFIRTHIFYQMKGFDERFFLYHEDSDLSRRITDYYGKLVYHPDMHVTHAWKRDSSHHARSLMLHMWSTVKFFVKWGWKW